ncbi:hypothetical protein GCM10011594_17790 [Nakamurella endophytica]|uniref:Uncharacterized protein n=1 Tax=Nakamurella endophytica TaxID=1748367 RepID=A0A917SVD9_9ACTN|nr:hypothetical protein GCM10011594_17790 [Nakamurella endophytica]
MSHATRLLRTGAARAATVIAAAAVLHLSLLTAASAAPAAVLVDDPSVTAAAADDGAWSATVVLSNLTTQLLPLTPSVPDRAGCAVTADHATLPAGQRTEVTLTVPRTCASGDAAAVRLGAGATSLDVTVTAPRASPWESLRAFWWALLGAAVLVLLAYALAWAVSGASLTPTSPLPGLPDTYSFKDSFVSNVTLIVGVVTAVLGSTDVLKAISSDSPGAVAVATVGAAIAAALVGATPVLLQLVRRDGGTAKPVNTVLGVLLATTVAVAAAAGELWLLVDVAGTLDIGSGTSRLVAGLIITGVLAVYTVRNTMDNLMVGSATREKPSAFSDPMAAAAALAFWLRPDLGTDEARAALEKVAALQQAAAQGGSPTATDQDYPYPPWFFTPTSPGDDLRAPPRRAVLP